MVCYYIVILNANNIGVLVGSISQVLMISVELMNTLNEIMLGRECVKFLAKWTQISCRSDLRIATELSDNLESKFLPTSQNVPLIQKFTILAVSKSTFKR